MILALQRWDCEDAMVVASGSNPYAKEMAIRRRIANMYFSISLSNRFSVFLFLLPSFLHRFWCSPLRLFFTNVDFGTNWKIFFSETLEQILRMGGRHENSVNKFSLSPSLSICLSISISLPLPVISLSQPALSFSLPAVSPFLCSRSLFRLSLRSGAIALSSCTLSFSPLPLSHSPISLRISLSPLPLSRAPHPLSLSSSRV